MVIKSLSGSIGWNFQRRYSSNAMELSFPENTRGVVKLLIDSAFYLNEMNEKRQKNVL